MAAELLLDQQQIAGKNDGQRMSNGRRTIDRRRRVLYSANQADNAPSTAASRRETERLREARRPTAAYGSRVHRRLRGRWFSMVPVRRRTMITIASLLSSIALLLCAAHYAAVAWPPLAYRPEVARPLRLDRPDSFGRWFIGALLAGSAGASLLIYQLRRYRVDDYQGRYRLWRLVLMVLILAGVNSLVSIVDWSGALLDAAFGKRVALTGGDWIRLVVSIGGAVLALRLIAEVRRSRFSLGLMILACVILAIPEAANWNVLQVDSLLTWTAVTSAPLLACTALFISLGGYLRMLYREVRQIEENDSLKNRFQQMRMRVFKRSGDAEAEHLEEDSDDHEPRRRRWGRRRPVAAETEVEREKPKAEESEQEVEEEAEDTAESSPRARRRWLGLRRAKTENEKSVDEQTEPTQDDQASDQSDEPNEKGPRIGRGWLRRKQKSDAEGNAAEDSSNNNRGPAERSQPTDEQSDATDPDDIDWDSLSKADRRRLRKQLKRQNRAA